MSLDLDQANSCACLSLIRNDKLTGKVTPYFHSICDGDLLFSLMKDLSSLCKTCIIYLSMCMSLKRRP
jgi:hypothetical protein